MKLLIISGRSGSGKSTVLNMLEDHGYYCIDNLPASLLPALIERVNRESLELPQVAVGIDARNVSPDLEQVPRILGEMDREAIETEILFLDADSYTLIKRFSENRRKHPLTGPTIGLREAIERERELLEPLAELAVLSIDTSNMSVHQLRDSIKHRVVDKDDDSLALTFQSFGYKNGVPIDADIVFDVRCLPNPHWEPELKELTGLDEPVRRFLASHEEVEDLYRDIHDFLKKWLPCFEADNRSYMTVALGCTGGQHRSVYLTERLRDAFAGTISNVQVLHRELYRRPAGFTDR